MSKNNHIHTLDATGLRCPMPVLRTRRKLDEIPIGDHLIVHATDKASWNDMAAFCASTGHHLVRSERCSDYLLYEILKK